MTARAKRAGAGSVAQQIALDLATFADLLASEARRLPLTLAEIRLLSDVAADGLTSGGVGRVLLGALVDAVEIAAGAGAELGARHGADGEVLLRKVRAIGVAGDLAIREAIAEWRTSGFPDTVEGYRRAGLNVLDPSDGPDNADDDPPGAEGGAG